MKWLVYNLAFSLVFPALLPGFLLRMMRRGGYRARMGDRFALYPKEILEKFGVCSLQSAVAPAIASHRQPSSQKNLQTPDSKPQTENYIWLHAVSVGEVQVALQLMREWRKAEQDVRFCFSTTSSTGWKIAEGGIGENDVLIYNPLDFPNFVKSALRTVKPRAIVLTESEIWPIFIRTAKKMGIPLFLINARVSDRSAPRYRLARCFFGDVFSCFTRIFAQSRLDEKRLTDAGAPPSIIDVTGSFKFDVAHRNPAKEQELRDWIETNSKLQTSNFKLLLGASTWPGEDEVLINLYKSLPDDVLLVIAPRHFEKADAVEANIVKAGFTCIRRSREEVRGNREEVAPSNDQTIKPSNHQTKLVFLADTTGELMGLYGIADAVFVGKSLCEHGSQNMIEPCMCGKPTIVGPYTENFRPVMSDLTESNAIVQVKDANELAATFTRWFSPEGCDEALALGKRAEAAVAARRGVVPRCVAEIRAALAKAPKAAEAAHGTKKRSRWLWLIPAAILCALSAVVIRHATRESARDKFEEAAAEQFRYKPIETISKFLGYIEKPDSFATNDIVYVTDAKRRKWKDVLAAASPDAAIVWSFNVKDMTIGDFKAALDSFPCENAHLWMPGEFDWVLTGRITPATVEIGDMLEAFSDESAFDDLTEAMCDSLPEFFANYAGDRMTCQGAFAGNPTAKVAPEFFVTQDIPDVAWIVAGDLDEDILEAAAKEMRSMMIVRRAVIEGNMLAKRGDTDGAIEKWAAAILRNPHDTMLLDRIHRLAVNAVAFENVGNLTAAAKCYETMLCIRPRDIAAVTAYANCLRRLGKHSMADDVMKRVEALKASMR